MAKHSDPSPHMTRRNFLRAGLRGVAGLSLAALGGTYYATRIEPSWLKTERIRVPIADLPPAFDGYRIVQISDMHFHDEPNRLNVEVAVQRALSLNADLLVITGDYVTGEVNSPDIYNTIRPLALSAPRDGIWTIMGNHDHWVDVHAVRQVVADMGIPELQNYAVPVTRGAEVLWLAGVDDIWTEHHDLDGALQNVPAGAPLILLAHEPDYADQVYPSDRVSLMLSGHSHGGQVNLPLLGAPIVPYLGQKYVRGLRKLGSMWLYTNRGVGNLMPVRFSCRPEVTEITLVKSPL